MASKHETSFDPKAFLATVGEGRSISTYCEDQVVFSQGERADAVFYIQEGKVKTTVVSEQGKEAVIAIFGEGESFGVECLARHTLRMSTATAIRETSIMRLEKAAMIRLIHGEPLFSEIFALRLLERTIRAEADLIDQLFNAKCLYRCYFFQKGVPVAWRGLQCEDDEKANDHALGLLVGFPHADRFEAWHGSRLTLSYNRSTAQTPAELRRLCYLAIAVVKKETDPKIKRIIASCAAALAQEAERLERNAH